MVLGRNGTGERSCKIIIIGIRREIRNEECEGEGGARVMSALMEMTCRDYNKNRKEEEKRKKT